MVKVAVKGKFGRGKGKVAKGMFNPADFGLTEKPRTFGEALAVALEIIRRPYHRKLRFDIR